MTPTRQPTRQLLHSLRAFLLSIEIAGKESTLPFISTPLSRANAEEHIRQLRKQLTSIQRTIL